MAIAVIHDLTGVGRCALSVALPVLSAMGYQACPAATALLSTHPRFDGYVYQPVTETLEAILAHWTALDYRFEAVYVGFLTGNEVEAVGQFIQQQKQQGATILLDPVMGDNGKLYRFFDDTMPRHWRLLLAEADIITPNYTEACALLNHEQQLEIITMMQELQAMGPKHVVVTGCNDGNSWYNYASDIGAQPYEAAPSGYPGTGDLFASALLGYYLQSGWGTAVERATAITTELVWKTYNKNTPPREGVCFEPGLMQLSMEKG